MLSGNYQRPIFFKRPLVHKLRNILSRHSASARSPALNSVFPIFIKRKRVALDVFLEVWSNIIEIYLFRDVLCANRNVGLLDQDNWETLTHYIAAFHFHFSDNAIPFRTNNVLHLHSFDHSEWLACGDFLANININ